MIYIIILGLIAGYREVIILCDRKSWNYPDFRTWFWFTNQADKRVSNWDSFHVSNGLYVLVLCIFCTTCATDCAFWVGVFNIFPFSQVLNMIAQVIALWIIYMYSRNIMMHVVLPLKPDFRYLIPLVGMWFKKKADV